MEDKKLLKEELYRILEIMNVSSSKAQLLTESPIDDLIQTMVKIGSESGDEAATVIAKLETDLGVPPGALKMSDVESLLGKKGLDAQYRVIGKILKKMGPAGVDNIVKKTWSQLSDLHTDMYELVRTLVKSGSKMTQENFNKYIDDMANQLIKSNDPNLIKIVDGLKREFKDRLTNSTEIQKVITDITKKESETAFKAEFLEIKNRIKAKGLKLDKKFPEEPGDEFWDFYTSQLEEAIDGKNPVLLEKIRNEMVAKFGTTQEDFVKNMKPYLEGAGLIGQKALDGALAIFDFLMKGVKKTPILKISLGAIAAYGLYALYEWYQEKSADSKLGCETPGTACYCWTMGVATFGTLSSEEKKQVLNSGIGCSEFESPNPPTGIEKAINTITGLEEFNIIYKDGTKKKLKNSSNVLPNPTPATQTYTNDELGFLSWIKDNGYTNPDYSGGLWYTDKNGTDQQATYSNGTFN